MNQVSGLHAAAASGRPAGSLMQLALRLARQWWPQLAALAAASAVVAATITGALGVGDAMQRGLSQLAVARLGRIDAALIADRWFTTSLVERLAAASRSVGGGPAAVVPAIVLEASVEAAGSSSHPRRSRATLLACDELAALGFLPPPPRLDDGSVLINAVLAESLGVKEGDSILLRMPTRSDVPADSPLGRRDSQPAGARLRVGGVLPVDGLGQFSLRPTQATQPLIVTPLETAQRLADRPDVANVCLATAVGAVRSTTEAGDGDLARWLGSNLEPTLEDLGLELEPDVGQTQAAREVAPGVAAVRLTSDRLILPPEADRAAALVLGPLGGQPSLAFLANAIEPGDDAVADRRASIPYSTMLGIGSTSLPVGDLVDEAGTLLETPADDELIINRWVADDLAAQGRPVAVGDRLRIRFFLPETIHGRVEEAEQFLRISGIAEMRGAAVARSLVPEVQGVSDEKSIADWDPPFPFEAARVRSTPPHDEDDRYWKAHGTTPKAFTSLATARRLAGSRFGQSTAWHSIPGAADLDGLRRSLAAAIHPTAIGFTLTPLRRMALDAARGSTPFGGLFLALSSFVVAAGLILVWLLFGLLVAARRLDIGTLSAIGWRPGRLALLLTAIGGIAAAIGMIGGGMVGPVWSLLLLRFLASAWNTSVAVGSREAFAAGPASIASLLPGLVGGGLVALAAIALAARRAAALPPQVLLRGTGDAATGRLPAAAASGLAAIAAVALSAAVASGALAADADSQSRLGMFFAAGAAALVGLLAVVRILLNVAGRGRAPIHGLFGLALRGIAALPGRAFAVIAMVAIAEFLIVAVSSFAVQPPRLLDDPAGPTGGWTQIVTLGEPSSIDPTDTASREGLSLDDEQQAILGRTIVERLRTNAGDDASCTNLYASARPAVLGVGPGFVARGGFRFVAHAPLPSGEHNPWSLLSDPVRGDERPVPAILDQATAQWALKLGGVGAPFTLSDDDGNPLACQIVGLLEPGILQGSVLISEADFTRHFPRRSGYGMALVDAAGVGTASGGRPDEAAIGRAVAAAWADAGPIVQTTRARLASLAAVQNTFLAGFQALGTLGLLLGTAGVAAMQVQAVIERLGQIGLLQAVGFPPARIRLLLVAETLLMVAAGLVVGTLAGTLAVLPSLAGGQASFPLGWIGLTSALTLAVAFLAGWIAARIASRVSPRDALRSA